jgi:ketosteroid isomerase-like protein
LSASDEYAITLAKTEYREGYNTGNVSRILSVIADSFTNMSEGKPSFYGAEGKESLRIETTKLFDLYSVHIDVIMIGITALGDVAYDYGWHKLTLTPKRGGGVESRKYRYCEIWNKLPDGTWKLKFFINNKDLEPEMLET